MPLDNLLANSQADAGSRIVLAGVQPLEDLEDPLIILRVNANAVVAHREDPAPLRSLGADMNLRGLLAMELKGVANQVLKKLSDLAGVHRESGQRIVGHDGLG